MKGLTHHISFSLRLLDHSHKNRKEKELTVQNLRDEKEINDAEFQSLNPFLFILFILLGLYLSSYLLICMRPSKDKRIRREKESLDQRSYLSLSSHTQINGRIMDFFLFVAHNLVEDRKGQRQAQFIFCDTPKHTNKWACLNRKCKNWASSLCVWVSRASGLASIECLGQYTHTRTVLLSFSFLLLLANYMSL